MFIKRPLPVITDNKRVGCELTERNAIIGISLLTSSQYPAESKRWWVDELMISNVFGYCDLIECDENVSQPH